MQNEKNPGYFSLLFGIATLSYSQWILQNPYPATSDLEKVVCINMNTALFFGRDAAILRIWQMVVQPIHKIITGFDITNHMTSADFPTPEIGYAVSYNGKSI